MINLNISGQSEDGLNILCLGAHCDDIELGCGGSILKLIESRSINSIHWITFCSTQERAKEAQNSAQSFLSGIENKKIIIHDFKDGFLPYLGFDVKEEFENLKKQIQPDLIFTHYRHDLHQDHRIICELTWNTFRNHFILEYEIPKYDGDLGSPNTFIVLDENIVEKKFNILFNNFKSQLSKEWFNKETLCSLMKLRAVESQVAKEYAEAFYCRKCILDIHPLN